MGATTTRVLTGLALLTLTACSGSADPAAPPTHATPTTTATASIPPSPSPTPPAPPAMPQAAKAHTRAGATAFVEYFWQIVNYAQATGDTAAIRRLSVRKQCAECEAGMHAIDEVYGAGGLIKGGASTLADLRASVTHLAGLDYATVDYVNSVASTDFDLPGVDRDSSDPPTTTRDRMRLGAAPGATWKVLLFGAAS